MRWSVVIACTLSGALHAQTLFTGRVVDAASGTPLPYCTVARTGSTQGTITNADGLFRITVGALDSVRFSFVGYTTRTLPFGRLAEGMDVRLAPAAIAIGEVVIRPDDRLYERVIRANKWIRQAPPIGSKLFFGMETYSRGLPVEMIHAYYTASLRGGELLDLELKNGRIGVATTDGRLFINYNTTKAFALIAITAEDSPFPTSPIETPACETAAQGLHRGRGEYRCRSGWCGPPAHRATDQQPGGLHHRALARTRRRCRTRGGTALQELPEAPLHPPLRARTHRHRGPALQADLEPGSRTLPPSDATGLPHGVQRPRHTRGLHHPRAHACLRPGQGFTLPLFTYHGELPDYRKIGWLPEDTAFWQRVQPPLPTARQEQAMRFLRMNDINHGGWFNELDNGRNFFKPPYALWSAEKRVRLIDLQDALALPVPDQRPTPKDSLALLVQFYLDMDTVNGRFIHRSFTVVDGYGTVVPEAREPWTDCFQNIWFDLCEIERRRMEAALNASGMDPRPRRGRVHHAHPGLAAHHPALPARDR
jgi:hypothetical protein